MWTDKYGHRRHDDEEYDSPDIFRDRKVDHHDHEADVDDSKPLPPNEGLNPAGPKYF